MIKFSVEMELKNRSVMLLVTIFGCQISSIYAHGMLMDPVSRGSRWRIDPSAPHDYNDNELSCGGLTVSEAFSIDLSNQGQNISIAIFSSIYNRLFERRH